MKIGKTRTTQLRRIIILIIVIFLSFFAPLRTAGWLAPPHNAESVVGIFNVVATVFGALLLIIELNESRQVSCCEMLSSMNITFIESKRLMKLYQELSRNAMDPRARLIIDDADSNAVHSADLMAYMTFYETINEYVKHGVIDIQQMDDLFGDRFFKLVHNETVQERELFAEPSSYVNIFELYRKWQNYRKALSGKHLARHVVLSEGAIPELYTEKKLYLFEKARLYMNQDHLEFQNKKDEKLVLNLRRLFPRHLSAACQLQDLIVEGIKEDNNHNRIFAPTTENEFLESMLLDYCYGLFNGETLVATCIIILPRETKQTGSEERNLCIKVDPQTEFEETLTFDTIQVHPSCRGYGIHKFFLDQAELVARQTGARYIAATVSPENKFSENSFTKKKYIIKNECSAYGSTRNLFLKDLSEKKGQNQNVSESSC